MLVINRKTEESIIIDVQGTPIYVYILRTSRGLASVGIEAPKEFHVLRSELPRHLRSGSC